MSYGAQSIDDEDIRAVVEVLKSDFLTQGPKIKEFEKALCDLTGARYCVAVANGTAALHMAVAALGIGSAIEGITSPNTFVASANCLIYNNIKPVFVDIDKRTYNIDPHDIEKKVTGKTKLIIPVHFAGQPADIKEINKIAAKCGAFIIEDAAHAIGSIDEEGNRIGGCKYSDMTAFSFHPVKTITTGEGGAITTNSEHLFEELVMLRTHGISHNNARYVYPNNGSLPWYYEMQKLGFNYRLTDLQASMGISQLKKLEYFKRRRREIVDRYNKAFWDSDFLTIPFEREGVSSCFHLYVLQIDFQRIGKSREEIMAGLRSRNIGTQVHYIPVYTHPYYQSNFDYSWGMCPVAEDYYRNALSIPLHPGLTDDDVDYIIQKIMDINK